MEEETRYATDTGPSRADALHAEALRARARRIGPQGEQAPQKPKRARFLKPRRTGPEEGGRHDGPGGPDGPDDSGERGHGGRRRRGRDRLTKRLILLAVVLALIVILLLIVLPRIDRAVEALTPNVSITVPDSIAALLPDETMGYTAVDFTNAILGESRERKELVVMEQDVDVTSRISQDLLRISLFSKVKVFHSYGTGVYTVSLDKVLSDDISVDEETKIIKVNIPHTVLSYVNVDVDKTEFEDTQRALLAIGDIKLTAEQKHAFDQSVYAALHDRLNEKALFAKADEIALNKVREILQPIVSSISDEYIVKIVME